MEAVALKLRSGKFIQECSKKFLSGKDSSKRMADSLPDTGGKKRILGDLTNVGQNAILTTQANISNKKGKVSHKSTNSENQDPVVTELKNDVSKSVSNDSDAMYVTALEDSVMLHSSPVIERDQTVLKEKRVKPISVFPIDVEDFDATCKNDPNNVPEYSQDIFKYYKEREQKFIMCKYLGTQPEVSKTMRAILVDWMVEVQESFELNHETLYLAVKLVDRYLMKHPVPKAKLQLIGATAMFVAAKFDERLPPLVDDFLYICDDSYTRDELLQTERQILQTIDFDLGIPLSYRFLRRYSRCAHISMEMLTLARFILETALMDYDLIDVSDSKMAAAALLLALKMKNQSWTPTLKYYSGYVEDELKYTLIQLNKNISGPSNKHLQTIRMKYSHKIFFEVSKVPPLQFKFLKPVCNSLP